MTLLSLQYLAFFLNKYKPTGRIADFGGTDAIGAGMIREILTLDDVIVKSPGRDKNGNVIINADGIPKKTKPEYIVLDYDNGVDLLKPVKGEKFDAGITMDLLEHTTNPPVVAKNISDSLKSGAFLFVTVPFVWELHNYPGDYFRFCPQGLVVMFSDMNIITMDIVRDEAPEEELPRSRIVAVFRKKEGGLTKRK